MIGTVSLPLIAPSSMTPDSVPDEPKAESLTSLELVLRHHAGHPSAIEVLFARYEVRLQRWAHGRLSK